jgi:membrane protease YdiL (CAAX protease family)
MAQVEFGQAEDTPEVPIAREELVPEDLRVAWGWLDLSLFLLVGIVAFLGLGLILIAGIALAHIHLAEIQTSPRLAGILNVIADVFLFLTLMGYLALQMRLRFRAPFWRTIGWRPLERGYSPPALRLFGFIATGLVLAFVVQIGSAIFGTKTELPIERLFEDRLTVILVLALSVLMAPLVEETIFRGYIYPVVARSFGRGIAIVATGALFGLLHAAQLWGGWTQIALLVFVGLVLTYTRATTKTVLASYLVHLSYNFTVSVGFVVGTHWLKVLPPAP